MYLMKKIFPVNGLEYINTQSHVYETQIDFHSEYNEIQFYLFIYLLTWCSACQLAEM